MIQRLTVLLVLLLALAGCDSGGSYGGASGCPHWAISVAAPRHMEAWVEELYVLDAHGNWYHVPQGVVGELRDTAGWSNLDGGGGGPRLKQAGAPMRVYVRWQSLAEPQAYAWEFEVPEAMRKTLTHREMGKTWYGPPQMSCRSDITVGVAPGGRTIVWVDGDGLSSQEMGRGQATVVPEGPWLGKGKEYAYPLSDKAKQYLETHSIPYGSW